MSNDEVYASGLLNRALDPATQPPEIRAFLEAEIELLQDTVADGMAVIDIGCGTGRHLAMLRNRLRIGVGVDYAHAYLVAREADGTEVVTHQCLVFDDGTLVRQYERTMLVRARAAALLKQRGQDV